MGKTTLTHALPAWSRGTTQTLMAGLLATLLAAAAVSASAQPAPPAPPPMGRDGPGMQRGTEGPGMRGGPAHGGMHGGGHGGMHDGMMFGGSPERMGRMIDRMLDGIDATDAQRTQIKQIAAAAAADVRAQRQAARDMRQRSLAILTAPNLDPAAAEQLRQQMLQQHDQTSRRITQAMLDAARVLTPEQRARIGARMKDRQAAMQDRMKRMERMPPR